MKNALILVVALLASSAYAKDLGYRYSDGVCKNAAGNVGLNPGYLGQCADLRNVTMLRFNLEDTDFSGSDFTSSDLQDSSFKNSILNDVKFSNSYLSGVVFDGAQGLKVDFSKASMVNTHLAGADLQDADFTEADLSGVQLSYLSFVNGNFARAKLAGAAMDHIDMSGADLTGASLDGADLTEATLDRATLSGARFTSANLTSAKLRSVNAAGAVFRSATLRRSNLQKAKFEGGTFVSSTLDGADLTNATFSNVDLRGSILKNARIDGANFMGSQYNRRTQLPFSQDKANEMGMVFSRVGDLLVLWDVSPDASQTYSRQWASLKAKLNENGIQLSFSNQTHNEFDGSQDLSEYGAVLHMLAGNYYLDMPAAGQRALVKFVNEGGTYMGTQWSSYAVDQYGFLKDMRDLIIMTFVSSSGEAQSYKPVADKASHPLLIDLSNGMTLAAGHTTSPLRQYVSNPAYAVMVNDQNFPMVAYREVGAGKVVNFAFAPYSETEHISEPGIQQLIINSISW